MKGFLRMLFSHNGSQGLDSIKESGGLYPKTSISILKITSSKGLLLTGWVNKGYKEYPYKSFFRYHFRIKVNLKDKRAASNPNLDMGTIEAYFVDHLTNACVCHLVARLATEDGLNLELYLENNGAGMVTLLRLANDSQRLVSFTYENNYDRDWKAVKGLLDL